MRILIFISFVLFAGCAESFNVTRNDCYKILLVDEYILRDYNLFHVQALKTGDTLYIVSKKVKDSAVKVNRVKLKIGKIINTDIKPADSLVLVNGFRANYPFTIYERGKLVMREDTMVARKFMSDDISGVYIKEEKVGCK